MTLFEYSHGYKFSLYQATGSTDTDYKHVQLYNTTFYYILKKCVLGTISNNTHKLLSFEMPFIHSHNHVIHDVSQWLVTKVLRNIVIFSVVTVNGMHKLSGL